MSFLLAGAVSGLLAVAIGAFGAHGLEGRVDSRLLEVYRTGVDYHMFHTAALLAVGLLEARAAGPALTWAGWLFLAGILVFSGSLYLMAVTGERWLGMVTPLGGLAFLAGWVALAIAVYRL